MDLKEKKLNGEIVFNGHLLEVHKDKVLCPNNHESYREYINKGPAACVIAKTNEGKFILEKQFRYPYDDIMIEFPAGKTDKNEDTKVTALRELKEETGYEAKKCIYLGETYPSVAYTNEKIYLYYCEDLTLKETNLDENEFVDVIYKNEDEIKNMILKGEIRDAKTVHAFLLYLLNKEKGNL